MQNPIVEFVFEFGFSVKAELYPEFAPNTVNNFISLANTGFYDGTVFHRCIPGFVLQGGDPTGSGMGNPGYAIRGEFKSNGFDNPMKHERGVLSMARSSQPDTAGSQFFFVQDYAPELDGEYAAFGKVIEGMEFVDSIIHIPVDEDNRPIMAVALETVRVNTHDTSYPEPETIELFESMMRKRNN